MLNRELTLVAEICAYLGAPPFGRPFQGSGYDRGQIWSGGQMRHDWVFDVLTDLHAYALRNELPGLAEKIEAALSEAFREIADLDADVRPPTGQRERAN